MNSEIMTRQAYSEVYNIINHFEKELYAKIPQSFINAIEKNRDLNYKVNIDYTKTINEQELLRETRVILSLIYRDYLCTDEQRKEIILNDKEELNEKYEINFEKIKNKRKKTYDTTEIEDKQLVRIEEKWYKRIFNKILSIFKSN